MRKIQRLAAVGAMAALTVALGACGSSEAPSTSAPSAAAPTSAAASNGVTQISDIFGPACSMVPTSGEGSAQGMVDDPVATAASNNPLVSTLVAAVKAGGLVETLNAAPSLTVLAPGNDAFAAVQKALGDEKFNALLANKTELNKILTFHVSDQRQNAAGLVSAGTMKSLAGGSVTVAGSADAPTFAGPGNTTPAKVLCGNIPTKNATVFVIDAVLMPTAS